MDANRFDDLTRTLGTARSRRQLVKLLASTLGGAIAGALGREAAAAAPKPNSCKNPKSCSPTVACCPGFRCLGGVCKHNRKEPTGCGSDVDCPVGHGCCNGACLPLDTVSNCGSCDEFCAPCQLCSNGICVDLCGPCETCVADSCVQNCVSPNTTCCNTGPGSVSDAICCATGWSCCEDPTPPEGALRSVACCPPTWVCETSTGACICPPETIPCNGRCVSMSCPDGEVFDPTSCGCIGL